MKHKKIIEAALFVSSKPLMLNEIGRIAGMNSLGYVREILEGLQKEYEGRDRGMRIVCTPDGWSMEVSSDILPNVSGLTPHQDMSEGSKRTLALVVYKEPVRQSEIIKIQGNKAYAYVKELVKRGLIAAEKSGHTKILRVTKEFERYFGEDKEKIKKMLSKEGGQDFNSEDQ